MTLETKTHFLHSPKKK